MRMNPFRPHASFFFTLLFFAGLTAWYIHTKPEINTKTADLIHLAAVLESEQSSSPKKPKILVAGSSFAGMGIHIGAIEKAAGLPAAKIAMNAGTPLDTFGIFENYGNILTKNTEILIIELAAFQFGQKQKDIRRTFFTKIKNAGRTFMPQDIAAWAAFVSEGRTSFSDFYKWFSKSHKGHIPPIFEEVWHWEPYRDQKEKRVKPALRKTAAEVRKKRLETGPDTRSTAADRERTAVLETQRTGLFRLLDLCREHGIFVVAVVTPKWYGQSDYTQSSLREKTDDPYIRVLQEIDKRPDCAVILSRDFEEITSEGSDEDYLFDYGHMTEEGAKVYTNWLMDRLMEMPKTAEAIRNRTTEIR